MCHLLRDVRRVQPLSGALLLLLRWLWTVTVLMVLVPRVRLRFVVDLLHRSQGHVHVLGVPRLQLLVGNVVGVIKI